MPKSIRRNVEGDANLLPVFVMLAGLMVTIIVISGSISAMLETNVPTGYFETKEGYDWLGGTTIDYASPSYGYNLTAANWTDNSKDDDANQKFIYDYDGFNWIAMRVVKDYDKPLLTQNPTDAKDGDDFVCVHLEKTGAVLSDDKWRGIPFDNLFNHWYADNMSYAYFTAWKTNFTIIITTDALPVNESVGNPRADHINSFYMGACNIKIGVVTDLTGDAARTSMWVILGQILTMQLPNVNWFVQMLISVPIWSAIGFLMFEIFAKLWPF